MADIGIILSRSGKGRTLDNILIKDPVKNNSPI